MWDTRLFPSFLVYYFHVKLWLWSPHPLPPPIFTRFTFPVQFACILSIFFLLPPLRTCLFRRPSPSSSVWSLGVRPAEVYNPPADGQPMFSPGFLSSVPYEGLLPPTYAAGGTWLRCGWRGEGDGAPCNGLEFLNAFTGVAQLSFLRRRSWTLVDSRGARLSVCPPLSLYNRICSNNLPPNRRLFSWSLRAPSPR